MGNSLFDSQHIKEYILYGLFAGVAFAIPVWYYLYSADYKNGPVVYAGCALFMFVIMYYSFKLTRRRVEHKSSMSMMIAGHMAVLAGIVASIIISCILCFIYIPGFFTGNSHAYFLANAPQGQNNHNTGTLFLIFLPATFANFGAGAFISVIVSNVLKLDQTEDKATPL